MTLGIAARVKEELGPVGLLAVAIIAATTAFWLLCIKPLEERFERLERRAGGTVQQASPDGLKRISSAAPSEHVEAFYRHFERRERVEDWLAAMYGMATAAGLELNSADYRLAAAKHRLDRYHITLPVSGSYAQIRTFIEATLTQIPVASLDQASFRRKAVNDARIEADLAFTLHLPSR